MQLHELSDDDLDEAIRSLLPSNPDRSPRRLSERDQLLRHISSGGAGSREVDERGLPLAVQAADSDAEKPERHRRWWAVAAALVMLVGALVIVREMDATPQQAATPATTASPPF